MPKRWCFDCKRLFDREDTGTWRCPACQAAADKRARGRRAQAAARRPSTTARGYGHAYRKQRDTIVARALELARAGQPQACVICGKPLLATGQITAQHLDELRHRAPGDRGRPGPLGPAHAACNYGWKRDTQ